ncbi:MAG: hypothetical protein JWQ08_557 [Deinococcus sp.]|nr:hypothetical protein [Deinococcus sp.]
MLMTLSPLSVPQDLAVYSRLSTDHYPWTEVTVDLAARQAQGFTGIFDAVQGQRWVRFVWVRGVMRGGYTAGAEVSWANMMRGLPQATVSLQGQEPAVAEIVWSCRQAKAVSLPGTWPDLQDRLHRERFFGILVSGTASSYWESGRMLGGVLPPSGAACVTFSPPVIDDRPSLLAFWLELIAVTHRSHPLDETWRQVSIGLATDHPCLDPFAQEVRVLGGVLQVDQEVSVSELRPALLAAYRATLTRLGVRLADLPINSLREQPIWATAGLEANA